MITIQKSAGVFGDSYEFPHLHTYIFDIVILLPGVLYTLHNILQFPTPTLQCIQLK